MNGAFSLIPMERSEFSDHESIDLKLVPGCPGSGWVGDWWLGGGQWWRMGDLRESGRVCPGVLVNHILIGHLHRIYCLYSE